MSLKGIFGVARGVSLYWRVVGKVCNCGVSGAMGGYS